MAGVPWCGWLEYACVILDDGQLKIAQLQRQKHCVCVISLDSLKWPMGFFSRPNLKGVTNFSLAK